MAVLANNTPGPRVWDRRFSRSFNFYKFFFMFVNICVVLAVFIMIFVKKSLYIIENDFLNDDFCHFKSDNKSIVEVIL